MADKTTSQFPPKKPGTIVDDPELAAMGVIMKKLNGLTPDARNRVVSYIVAKYQPPTGAGNEGG